MRRGYRERSPQKRGDGIVSQRHPLMISLLGLALCTFLFSIGVSGVRAEELRLEPLIEEALKNNPDINAAQSKAAASQFRIPQAKSLPDPMVMFGYQNSGTNKYTFGEMDDSQYMFSASQMFPFPGKRGLKGEMAAREAEGISAAHNAARLRTVARIKELYYDLFLAYKNIDLINDRTALFSRLEDSALARYSAGAAMQQDVLMAQTEKYMLLEKEEMLKQKVQSLEAMLNAAVGRQVSSPLGRPVEPVLTPYARTLDELIMMAASNSPEIKEREKMVAAADAKVQMAKKEYYPDITVTGSYGLKGGGFPDMWSVTTAINIPLYYKTKQRPAVHEAQALLSEARSELEASKLMLTSGIRDTYSMMKAAERLMDLYKNGLIPKTYQDFQAALAGYTTGKSDALTVITRLKNIIESENSYWIQVVEREKAIARVTAAAGIADPATEVKEK